MPNEKLLGECATGQTEAGNARNVRSRTAPPRARSAFQHFLAHLPRSGGKKRIEDLKEAWEALTEEEKAEFQSKSQEDAMRYERQMREYEQEGRYYDEQGNVVRPIPAAEYVEGGRKKRRRREISS